MLSLGWLEDMERNIIYLLKTLPKKTFNCIKHLDSLKTEDKDIENDNLI